VVLGGEVGAGRRRAEPAEECAACLVEDEDLARPGPAAISVVRPSQDQTIRSRQGAGKLARPPPAIGTGTAEKRRVCARLPASGSKPRPVPVQTSRGGPDDVAAPATGGAGGGLVSGEEMRLALAEGRLAAPPGLEAAREPSRLVEGDGGAEPVYLRAVALDRQALPLARRGRVLGRRRPEADRRADEGPARSSCRACGGPSGAKKTSVGLLPRTGSPSWRAARR
jgi:hypothetical protein